MFKIFQRDAAHHNAGRKAAFGNEALALDNRRDILNFTERTDFGREIIVIVKRTVQRIDIHVTVEAENAAEEFLTETVHHRHDDNERRNAEHNASEGETRNN